MAEAQEQLACTNKFVLDQKFKIQEPIISKPLEKQAFVEIVKSGNRFTADRLYYIANEINQRQQVIKYDGELPFFFECVLITQAMYVGEARNQIESLNFTRKLASRGRMYTLKFRIEGKGEDINKTYMNSVYQNTNPILIKRKINALLDYFNNGDHMFHIKQFTQS